MAHALTRAERKLIIPVGEAVILLGDVLSTLPAHYPSMPILKDATIISSQTRSSVNDCLYLQLSIQEGCEMVTGDKKLINNVASKYSLVKPLSTMPV